MVPPSTLLTKLTNPIPRTDWQNNGGYDEDTGLDIIIDAGTPCIVAADGEVIYAEQGHTPWIEDTDLSTLAVLDREHPNHARTVKTQVDH